MSLTPVANLPPVSTIPAANFPPVSTTPVAMCHRHQRHRWCTLSCEYLHEFSKKFGKNGRNGIFRGLGGNWFMTKSLRTIPLTKAVMKPYLVYFIDFLWFYIVIIYCSIYSKQYCISCLECDDESVLAGHEDGHVGDHLVVQDQHQPEHEERSVLNSWLAQRATRRNQWETGKLAAMGVKRSPWCFVNSSVDVWTVFNQFTPDK